MEGEQKEVQSGGKENGRFIIWSVADVDGKRHRLFFPEGNGRINGWTL